MINVYEMYKEMIRNAYNKGLHNKRQEAIKELKSIKETINLTPMKYVIDEKITLSQIKELSELIETNIEMVGE